jgi:hypothetical protein
MHPIVSLLSWKRRREAETLHASVLVKFLVSGLPIIVLPGISVG